MEKRNLICIVCPMGCPLTVTLEDGKVTAVEGNTCKRGYEYAVNECTAPKRVLTTSVRVEGGNAPLVSVKTESGIPKELLFDAMKTLRAVTVKAPVRIGDVVYADLCGTGVNVIAGKNID